MELTRRALSWGSPSCLGRWGSCQSPWLVSCRWPPVLPAAAGAGRSLAQAMVAGRAAEARLGSVVLLLLLPLLQGLLLLLLLPPPQALLLQQPLLTLMPR